MTNYYSIQAQIFNEIEIKKSRFLTYLIPIKNEDEFNQHLASIRKEHYKATHHCQAYILEEDSSIQRMSDDGEPSGTAGVPMLEVLKQNQLTYIMAVTVRYFGGTKLGAGGLIRAYSTSVSEALTQGQIIANVNQSIIQLSLDYSQIDPFNHFLETSEHVITILDTQYTDKVTYQLALFIEVVDSVQQAFSDLFSGQFDWESLGERAINVPVK